MLFGSLFSGIGGLDLGLERAGWECRWQVENDPYAIRVLEKHWPDVTRYAAIEEVNWNDVERPDLICGGFPCQPVSVAGKQLGKDDARWLWPEFVRCLRAVRPRWVLVENVPGLLARGMGDVLGDLVALGYDAEWESLPAAAFGAPHLRYRVFIVANRSRDAKTGAAAQPRTERQRAGASSESSRGHAPNAQRPILRDESRRRSGQSGIDQTELGNDGSQGVVADAQRDRLEGQQQAGAATGTVERAGEVADAASLRSQGTEQEPRNGSRWENAAIFRTQPGNEGWWSAEPDVGRVAHGVFKRVDRLRCLGNAVVPQVAEWIGRRMLLAEHHGDS